MSQEERLAIQHLAQDIPALWKAETTTAMDRQMIVRQLIERILVTVIDNTEKVQTEIHWYGGHITTTWLDRPVAKLEQMAGYQTMILKTVVEHIPTNKNQHKVDKENWIMLSV